MSFEITFTEFTPRQAEQITGVSVDQQRDWRRHGYLNRTEGHARFDAYDLARLLFVRAMGQRGIGPQIAFRFAETCATGIVFHATRDADAFSGDLDDLTEAGIVRQPEVDPIFLDSVRAVAVGQYGEGSEQAKRVAAALSSESILRSEQAEYLQRYISRFYRGGVIPASYFIIWADGTEFWHEDIQAAFDDLPDQDPKVAGPVIVVSLVSMGVDLLRKSQLPLFSFRVAAK